MMTTAQCWAAISSLLVELKKRIKNREDVEFFHKLEARYKEAENCQRKEIDALDAKHAEEKAKLYEKIAELESIVASHSKPRGSIRVITGTRANPEIREYKKR